MSPALLIGLSAEVVAAYVAHNAVPAAEVPRILASVHAQLSALAAGPTPAPPSGPTRAGTERR